MPADDCDDGLFALDALCATDGHGIDNDSLEAAKADDDNAFSLSKITSDNFVFPSLSECQNMAE